MGVTTVYGTAIGAIGDIPGATAVVVTLLPASKQPRQNSRAVRVAARRDTTAQWNHRSEHPACSPHLVEVVSRGTRSCEDLPGADALRYGACVQMFFDNAENYHTRVNVHEVEKDMGVIDGIVRRRISVNGVPERRGENADDCDKYFADWINKLRRDGD